MWFLWHETFLNSSSFLPLVVKHLFEYRAFRCGEYEYIPYAKKCQGYFSFFLDFFDFFFAALREPARGCAAGARDRTSYARGKFLFWDDGGTLFRTAAFFLRRLPCRSTAMTGVFWSALAAGLFWDGGGLVTRGVTQGLYKLKCQLLQIPNQVRDDGPCWGWWRLVSAPALRLGSGTGMLG